MAFQPVVRVNGETTVSRVVVLTVDRQDISVTSLMVTVYLGVYQEGGGDICAEFCNPLCTPVGQICDVTNGQCVSCTPGYWGIVHDCSNTCNQHCTQTGQICDISTGTCLYGCIQKGEYEPWLIRDTCDIVIRKYESETFIQARINSLYLTLFPSNLFYYV